MDVPVLDCDICHLGRKQFLQPLDNSHRPVLTTGAADSQPHFFFTRGALFLNKELQKWLKQPEKFDGRRTREDIGCHITVKSGFRPHLLDPVGIRQKSDIPDQSGLRREAILEAEGRKGKLQR